MSTTEEMSLRQDRLAVGLSIAECCRASGTPRKTWENWEYGRIRPPSIAQAWLELYIDLKNKGGENG